MLCIYICLIDYESTTVASSFSSPYQENEYQVGVPTQTSKNLTTCSYSEEYLGQKRDEDQECLKEAFNYLKMVAKKLKRNQTVINTSMVFFLKYTRIYSFTSINKFLVASACFLLGAKCHDEPVPIEFLVEWYIYLETKRFGSDSKVDISDHKKKEYSTRIQEQEFDILCEIGFDCEVDLPNKYIVQFAATPLGKKFLANPNCSRFALRFLNDSFMTTCSLYYTPQQIAAASIYMAIVYMHKNSKSSKDLPELSVLDNSDWYASIDESLDLTTIIEVKDEIKKCYVPKPSAS